MLYAGTFNSYLVQVVSNDKQYRVSLLTPNENTETRATYLNPVLINTIDGKMLKHNIISTGVISRSSRIRKYYGDLSLLSQFISLWADTKFFIALNDGAYYTGSENINGYDIDISICNENIVSCSALTGFEYTNFTKAEVYNKALETDETFQQMQYTILSKRLRSLQDLRDLGYDLSWYEDSNKHTKKDYKLITTEEELGETLRAIGDPQYKVVAVDTEFSNKEIFWKQQKKTRLFGMSISWKEDQAVYIVFESTKTNFLEVEKYIARIVKALNESPNSIVVQNAFAEIKSCWNYDQLLHIDYDTLLIEFNLNIDYRLGERGLKELARIYFGSHTIELEDIFNGKIVAELIPEFDPDIIKVYACADADFTRKVFFRQQQSIDVNKVTITLDCRIIEILALAEYYGARIDKQLLQRLREYNKQDLKRIEFLAYKYLHEVGMRTQASLYLDGDELTENNIDLIMADPRFQEDMKVLFSKDAKKNKKLQKLGFRSPDDKKILYTILQYPITRRTTGEKKGISANVDAIEDLLTYKTAKPLKFLAGDVKSVIATTEFAEKLPASDMLLIDKDKFESYRYPFAYLLQVWRKLDKRETSFFATLDNENNDGWYYTSTSMVAARTARVINKIQTLEGALKALVVPFSDMYYYMVFDKSQIEFRVMMGIANNAWKSGCQTLMNSEDPKERARGKEFMLKSLDDIIERLDDPFTDYHREGGSKIVGTTPAKMTRAQRSTVKPIHFSVPFGASAYNIAADAMRKAKTEGAKQDALYDTENVLSKWRDEMYPLYWFLEDTRDTALKKVPDSELPERLKGMNLGRVRNALGRTRYFLLDPRAPYGWEIKELCDKTGTDQKTAYQILSKKIYASMLASIRREAGNFPIQSLAREIFFSEMLRLYNALKQEKMTAQHRDFFKVLLSMFVHDECGCQVHRSVHIYKMYKLIYENCITRLKGHPAYFMGVAVAENWADGKADEYEASMYFVKDCVDKYDANPAHYDEEAYHITNQKLYAFEDIKQHFRKLTVAEYTKWIKANNNCSLQEAMQEFPTYYISQHLGDYCVKLDPDGNAMEERIKFCFAEYGTDDSINLGELNASQLREKYADLLKQNHADPQKYVSAEDVIPREEVNHINEDGAGVDEDESVDSIGNLLELGLDAMNSEDDAVLTSEFSAEIDFDTIAMSVPSLDELMTADSTFSDDDLYFSESNNSELTDISDRERDRLENANYTAMLDIDPNDYINMVIQEYLGSESLTEEVKKDKPLPLLVVIYNNRLTLRTQNVPKERVFKAVEYLATFKGDSGLILQTSTDARTSRIGNKFITRGFSVDKVNRILNGVE